MSSAFGPWSTSMSTGIRVELNTFWKRRMAMLPRIASLRSEFPRGGRWSLTLLGVALLALPTWYQQAQSQESPVASKTTAIEKPQVPTTAAGAPASPPPGRSAAGGSAARIRGPEAVPGAPGGFIGGLGGTAPGTGSPLKLKPPFAGQHPMPAVKRPLLPPMEPPTVEFLPEPMGVEKKILGALEEQVDFDFMNDSLDGIVTKLAEQHDIQIVFDRLRFADESVATDAKGLTRKLSGISLRSGLNLLLQQKQLAFFIEDEVLKITTKTDAINKRPTRTYPVRDLVGNIDVDYLLLSQTIQESTGGPPDNPWMPMDGEGGSVSVFPSSGCLVIRQTHEGHEQVLGLLRSLRKANAEMKVKE